MGCSFRTPIEAPMGIVRHLPAYANQPIGECDSMSGQNCSFRTKQAGVSQSRGTIPPQVCEGVAGHIYLPTTINVVGKSVPGLFTIADSEK